MVVPDATPGLGNTSDSVGNPNSPGTYSPGYMANTSVSSFPMLYKSISSNMRSHLKSNRPYKLSVSKRALQNSSQLRSKQTNGYLDHKSGNQNFRRINSRYPNYEDGDEEEELYNEDDDDFDDDDFDYDDYAKNGWKWIDNKWYYFDAAGYMETGWIHVDDDWYYLKDDGSLLTNARTPDGYWVDEDGEWDGKDDDRDDRDDDRYDDDRDDRDDDDRYDDDRYDDDDHDDHDHDDDDRYDDDDHDDDRDDD